MLDGLRACISVGSLYRRYTKTAGTLISGTHAGSFGLWGCLKLYGAPPPPSPNSACSLMSFFRDIMFSKEACRALVRLVFQFSTVNEGGWGDMDSPKPTPRLKSRRPGARRRCFHFGTISKVGNAKIPFARRLAQVAMPQWRIQRRVAMFPLCSYSR